MSIARHAADFSPGKDVSYELSQQIRVATLFLRRLAGLPLNVRRTISVPGYQDEYYVQATMQVRMLIKSASGESPGTAEQMNAFVQRAEGALERAGITGDLGSVVAEAVRALLIWPLTTAQPWASSVYQPFEALIPHASLLEVPHRKLAG